MPVLGRDRDRVAMRTDAVRGRIGQKRRFASIAGFKRNDAYFKATEASREVPKVEFPPPNR